MAWNSKVPLFLTFPPTHVIHGVIALVSLYFISWDSWLILSITIQNATLKIISFVLTVWYQDVNPLKINFLKYPKVRMWFWKFWDLRTNFLWNPVSLDLILYEAHRKMQDLLKPWLFPSTMSVWLCILYKNKFFYFHLKWKTIKFHETKLWISKPSFSPSGM